MSYHISLQALNRAHEDRIRKAIRVSVSDIIDDVLMQRIVEERAKRHGAFSSWEEFERVIRVNDIRDGALKDLQDYFIRITPGIAKE